MCVDAAVCVHYFCLFAIKELIDELSATMPPYLCAAGKPIYDAQCALLLA